MGRGGRLPEETTDMIRGFKLSYNTVAIVNIATGICRSDDDECDIVLAAADSASLAVSGAGGLDTGVEASSTWYYVWVILNPVTQAVDTLLSTSSTAPTLPAGFTKKRRIGVIRNDGSSNIRPFIQRGKGNDRMYGYVQLFSVLSNGAADTWTSVSCAAYIPPTNTAVIVELTGKADGEDGQTSEVRIVSSLPGNSAQLLAFGNKNDKNSTNTEKLATDGSQSLEYQGATGDSLVDIGILGFDEEL